ncbi:uncharacterized protein DUF4123 [Pseudoduganella flava]|uniref:DUF4123 domain-containing protein n=1 Tax=Pseudoduganella flava TaxID=871742 RepID=A0A562PFX8_9BURK|nr:DUF4123 domain-containing protein [Pseudoduganella flava]QGZ40205.1 DUF4123 domain-containing protein [Pseudoduganella flava]TWI43382.1 uncharacterized protein DUF4123 [Pseudoduganella flava]
MADLSIEEPDYPALDAPWTSHLQALHRYFHEAAEDACLLWVDPAQGDPFDGSGLVEERRVRVPIAHPRFEPQFAPYLVPLHLDRSADADLFGHSVRMAWQAWDLPSLEAAQGQRVCGWIRTSGEAAVLAQHWAGNCYLHVHGALHKLLRFHDPGVREWLWLSLGAQQKRTLLGPAQTLLAFGRTQQLKRQEMADGGAAHTEAPGRLVLTAEQWAQVDDYATLHAAWLAERSARAAVGVDVPDDGFDPRPVFAALKHATRHGIVDAQDRVLFARHALALGPEFHTDERLLLVWKLTAQGDFYGGAIEEVTGVPVDELAAYLGRP